MSKLLDKIVSLCKRRGFIFQSSEIYGGLGAAYDYGPLGVELKRNVHGSWWQAMVYQHDNIEGVDASILMHPKVWKASGHVDAFHDPLIDDKASKRRYKADQLIEGHIAKLRGKGKEAQAEAVGRVKRLQLVAGLGEQKGPVGEHAVDIEDEEAEGHALSEKPARSRSCTSRKPT